MARQKQKSARSIAAEVLNQCDPKRYYISPVLDKLLEQTDEKQRTTDLVFGTIRNTKAIDTVITEFSSRPVKRISDKLLNILRIGTYELIYCPDTASHAIVNEAVENVKATASKKQVGFTNAVLRQITRGIKNRRAPLSQTNPKRTLSQSPETGCEFNKDFLPDPETSPAGWLSINFSLPEWLIENWLSEFGAESTRQICLASNRRPSVYIRPNILKTTTQKLAKKFRSANINSEIVDVQIPMSDAHRESGIENRASSMIRIKSPHAVTQLPGFAEGEFTVQDIIASQVVWTLKPQSSWTILDLCAAPGTKATQLAEATSDSAKITATDIDAERLKKVQENITRLGIKSIEIVPYNKIQNSKFDCILLDVPCSNTGVLAKRIEARYRIKPDTIKKLTKTQSELLDTAAAMLKPHGKICYSTCTLQKAENSELIKDFLNKNNNFELELEKLTLPSAQSFDHDGGYTAILTKQNA
jgi:16S rRNA (cytosine967-C5)-methyltransferase